MISVTILLVGNKKISYLPYDVVYEYVGISD